MAEKTETKTPETTVDAATTAPPVVPDSPDGTAPTAAQRATSTAGTARRKAKDRFEEYKAVRPADGVTVKVRRNIETGDTEVDEVDA